MDWIALGSLITSVASAVAALFAWRTSQSSLELAKVADARMQRDALMSAKERFTILSTDVRMKKAMLSAMAADTENLVRSGAVVSGNFGSTKMNQALNDVEANRNVVALAEVLIANFKAKETGQISVEEYAELNAQLSSMQVSLDASLSRMTDLRTQAAEIAQRAAGN